LLIPPILKMKKIYNTHEKENQMTPQKQTEAMITLEYGKSGYSGYGRDYPNYMKDYNAVHRVLNGLTRVMQWRYHDELQKVTSGTTVAGKSRSELAMNSILATPAEMTEAIVKACGLWQPEETA